MNPIRRVWEWLYPPAAPRLRNRPGGMAWIVGMPSPTGEAELTNRAVKTVRINADGLWQIEPEQTYTCRAMSRCPFEGSIFFPGETVTVYGIPDAYLEPWKEDGVLESEVSALYQPSLLPQKTAQSAESNFHLADGGREPVRGSEGRTA